MLLLLLLLCACSKESPSDSDDTENVVGWRSAGISWPDAGNTGGVVQLKAVGDHLFAMDCYTPEADAEGNRYKRWRLWTSHVGTDEWTQLHLPDTSAVPFEIIASGSYLFVTSLEPGGIWRYNPSTSEWLNIVKAGKAPVPEGLTSFSIGFLGAYKGNLAMSVWNKDTLICWIGDLEGNNGETIPCPGKSNSVASMEMQELNGSLYGISPYYGIFRYTEGAASWDSLPSARGRKETITVDLCQDLAGVAGVNTDVSCSQEQPSGEIEGVTSITAHNGHIIIGYKANANHNHGVFRLEDNDTWTNITPKYMFQDTVALSDASETTEALLSYQGWLIAGGYYLSYPRFWVPRDSAKPQFGDWKHVNDNWTELAGDYFAGVKTSDLLGVGDTLYAATWTTVLKLPLQDVPKLMKYRYKSYVYPHLQDSLAQDSMAQ